MKIRILLSLALLGFFLNPAARASVVIQFNDTSTFQSQFPTSAAVGTTSAVEIAPTGSPDHLQLYAGGKSARATVYSDASFSSQLDFISSPGGVTVTFSDLFFTFSSPGATFDAYAGIFSSTGSPSGGPVTGDGASPQYGVFFRFNRRDQKLELAMQSGGSSSVVLDTWDADAPGVGYRFKSLSLTLTASTWALTGEAAKGQTISGNGTFDTAFTTSDWGNLFYLGLEADQVNGQEASESRYAQLTTSAITIVPEPQAATMAAFVGIGALFLLGVRRLGARREALDSVN